MNQAMLEVNCDVCLQQMRPLAVHVRPESSEWYCEKDHKSKPMDTEVARYIISHEGPRK